jgi:hypothetical protein
MTQTSRRNLLGIFAGFTTAAVAAPVVQALPVPAEEAPNELSGIRNLGRACAGTSSDPVFAAIERWTKLEEISVAMEGTDFEAAAILDARRARLLLATTAPTTLAGLNALTTFVGDWGREIGGNRLFFFEPGEEATAYAKSIARTVALLEAQDRDDPVFELIERHRLAWERYGALCRHADELDELYVEHVGEAKVKEAFEGARIAELALIETSVTSHAGWQAVLDYEAECGEGVFFNLSDGESLSDVLSRKCSEGIAQPAPRRKPQLTIAHRREED